MGERPTRERKRSDESIMTDLVLPNQTNYYQTMFGGAVMAMMDKAAAIAAIRFCRKPLVTAASDRISFRYPIHQSDIIEARSRVIHTGTSSMIVRVHVYSERPLTGERMLCTTGYFSMVAIDSEGHPQSVPELIIEGEDELSEWLHGAEIRQTIQNRS